MVSKNDLDKVWGHIETTNREMGDVQNSIVEIKTNLTWVMKLQWFAITLSSLTLVSMIAKAYLGI